MRSLESKAEEKWTGEDIKILINISMENPLCRIY